MKSSTRSGSMVSIRETKTPKKAKQALSWWGTYWRFFGKTLLVLVPLAAIYLAWDYYHQPIAVLPKAIVITPVPVQPPLLKEGTIVQDFAVEHVDPAGAILSLYLYQSDKKIWRARLTMPNTKVYGVAVDIRKDPSLAKEIDVVLKLTDMQKHVYGYLHWTGKLVEKPDAPPGKKAYTIANLKAESLAPPAGEKPISVLEPHVKAEQDFEKVVARGIRGPLEYRIIYQQLEDGRWKARLETAMFVGFSISDVSDPAYTGKVEEGKEPPGVPLDIRFRVGPYGTYDSEIRLTGKTRRVPGTYGKTQTYAIEGLQATPSDKKK